MIGRLLQEDVITMPQPSIRPAGLRGSVLIVGGYGVVGSRIAADLAVDFPGRVLVAGRHLDRAEAAAAEIGYGVRGRRIDVTVPSSIAAALDGVSVAVNCTDQPERGLLWPRSSAGWRTPTSPRT
jgi:glutamyl-tRNA reductase